MVTTDTTRLAYSVTESAAMIGVSRNTIWRLLKAGELTHARVRDRVVIPRKELDRLLAIKQEGSTTA